tara:strand:- start:4231 stop:5160 length:930 start_codon:yes stop_codon:yes gene_type:complete
MGLVDGYELKKGTAWQAAIQAAPAVLAGVQASQANRAYGKRMQDIENFRRQDLENPFANMSNPYENLAVATRGAEIQMEQTDQALANTLDTLRETGAAAGGATAIANAALKSKQGVAASIEKQEADNQKLQAQGQLQVDIYKGRGEDARIQRQENRDVNELNRLQSQADTAQFTRNQAIDTGIAALGSAGQTLAGGLVPNQIPDPASQQSAPVDTYNNLGLNNSSSQSLNALNPISQNLPNYSSVQTVGQANNIMQANQGPQTPVSSVPVASVSGVLPPGFDMTKRLLDPDDEIAFGLTWDTALNKYTQ